MACPYSLTKPYLKAFEFKGWGCGEKGTRTTSQFKLVQIRIQSRPKHDLVVCEERVFLKEQHYCGQKIKGSS
jgi:hypothetical protein